MEFWGVEVKPGETLKVKPGQEKVLHLSQASLGEVKKDKGDAIILHVKIDDNKLVVGTLSTGKSTHISYDLVFEKDFELSHTGKNGSVYFCGYRSVLSLDDDEDLLYGSESEDSDSGEDLPVMPKENGKPEDNKAKKDNAAKTDCAADAKTGCAVAKMVKLVDPKKGKKPMADDSDDDSDDESDDEEMVDSDDSSDEEGDSSDEEEATPEKVQQCRKKPAESGYKTDKKAKLVTPQKSGGDAKKGGGHTATSYPKGGKTPASGNQSKQQQSPKSGNQQSPKSGGQKRNFTPGSGGGLHNKKGKHSGGK